MDYKSNYTFSNKFNNSQDMIFSDQNSRLLNNNPNINYINQTNNFINISYFNYNNSMSNLINPINNNNKNIKKNININNNINNTNTTDSKLKPENKIINEKSKNFNQFNEEFTKIKNIINNDPSRNTNLNPEDCFDLYGYPFITPGENYSFSQFNNPFKQKYLIKTLFDNKYIYINGKQYHRIMKRREVRKKLNEAISNNKNKIDKNKKYHHESRHRHAMNRERGKGGRFISKKKIEMIKKNKNNNNDDKENEDNELENSYIIKEKEKEKIKK